MSKFGEALRAARKKSSLPTIPVISRALGISVGGYTKYETGERVPPPNMLEDIITKAKVPPAASRELRELRLDAIERKIQADTGIERRVDKMLVQIETEVKVAMSGVGAKLPAKTMEALKRRIGVILRNHLE